MHQDSSLHEAGQGARVSTILDASKFIHLELYRQNWAVTFVKRRFKQTVMFRTGTPSWQGEDCFSFHGATCDCPAIEFTAQPGDELSLQNLSFHVRLAEVPAAPAPVERTPWIVEPWMGLLRYAGLGNL